MKPLLNESVHPPSHIPAVKIFALGGLNEIGKNMYAVQCGREILIVDSGVKFPGADMPGVDYIIPNIEYLLEHRDQVKAIILTHGHEDHIGALPFVLQQIQVPIYGAALTIGFVRAKLEEHGLLRNTELHLIHEDSELQFHRMSVQFFRTHHSIPDSLGVVIETPQGTVVHTGDFKFDFTPVDKPYDYGRLAEIGKKGVLVLLADSTNSEKPGYTPSERTVGEAILETFTECKGRILFATFASNVHRLQQVVEAAAVTGRKVAVIGRSMERAFRVGQELNYIRNAKDLIIDVNRINQFPDNQIVIVCTGSQGEPNAALTRIASGSHQKVSIYPGDTVIFSSSPIPGNAENVNRSIDRLLRAGADIVAGSIMDIHASGHGCQEDLKLMHAFLKPKYFMPIHGEYRMLYKHAELAVETGMPRENIFIMDIGQVLHVTHNTARIGKKIEAGSIYVKASTISHTESSLVEERKKLSESGVVIVNLVVDPQRNMLLAGPDLVTRGFVYVRESSDLVNRAAKVLAKKMTKLLKQETFQRAAWENTIVSTLASYFEKTMDRSPLILPVVMEVNR
jgi:ribonuclease J